MKNNFPIIKSKNKAYSIKAVDSFLEETKQSFKAADSKSVTVSSRDLRRISFPLVKKGYSARHVDVALDRLEEVFLAREKQSIIKEHGAEFWESKKEYLKSQIMLRLSRPNNNKFKKSGIWVRGYNINQVDALCQKIYNSMINNMDISLREIKESSFVSQRHGYSEKYVDYFLDCVAEMILTER